MRVLGYIAARMGIALLLSFLGLGAQPPYPSRGSLLQLGAAYLTIAPWLVFPPGIILSLAILSVNLVGDGLRDAIDPLMRRAA